MAHILLYGPGDLGERIIYQLLPHLHRGDRLTIGGRRWEAMQDIVHMARMQSIALGAGIEVEALPLSLDEREAWWAWFDAQVLDVAIFTATHLTWWKLPRVASEHESLLQQAGFGLWLPFQATLLLQFASLMQHMSHPPWLVIGPYPDVTAPLVKRQGLSRIVGFGNVDELAMATGDEVRLVAHHSVEAALFAERPLPSYRLWRRGSSLEPWASSELIRPFEWPSGTRSHVWTAASAVRTVRALLSEIPVLLHVPGPMGLPGGYPVYLSSEGVEVTLPEGVAMDEAIRVNREAAQDDGIASIDADGRVRLTPFCQEAVRAIFGIDCNEWGPTVDDWIDTTERLQARLKEGTS